jgi:tetratricopeptide (TPR) repeat protein
VVLERVFELLEEWTQNYPEDTWSRLLFTSVGRELGDTVRLRSPQRALAIYDHALLRLREVENNPEARRGEAEILAASAYALRRLNRTAEAKEKIDAALRILGAINEYPAQHIVPHTAVYEAVLALGDHLSETGQARRAVEVYEDLLEKITASTSGAQNNLRQAVAFSEIYASLAALHRRNGHADRGGEFATLGLDLWRNWHHKLPNSSFVRRQLEAARNL